LRSSGWLNWTERPALKAGFTLAKLEFVAARPPVVPSWNVPPQGASCVTFAPKL
jgi:hypothetical protein